MAPNWRVLKAGTGAERWLESPDEAIADTGNEDKKGYYSSAGRSLRFVRIRR